MERILVEIILEEKEEAVKIIDELEDYILRNYNVEQVVVALKK